MIELKNIVKCYRTTKGVKTVLDNISAEFPPGRNIGILGRNGAGKSTLMRLLSGAELPTSGQVIRHASVSFPIGFGGGFNGSLSGRENLRFICRIYNADIRKVTQFVEEFSELGDYMDMPIKTYSSGMKGKLSFGLSMALDFDYYLVDEVTATGDSSFKKKSAEVFERRKGRSTLIMVSHGIGTIRKHCNAAAVLEKGRLTFYDDLEEAISIYENFDQRLKK